MAEGGSEVVKTEAVLGRVNVGADGIRKSPIGKRKRSMSTTAATTTGTAGSAFTATTAAAPASDAWTSVG